METTLSLSADRILEIFQRPFGEAWQGGAARVSSSEDTATRDAALQ